MPIKDTGELKVYSFFLKYGSGHIQNFLIGVKYRNTFLTLDVYLLFGTYLGGANTSKTDLHTG